MNQPIVSNLDSRNEGDVYQQLLNRLELQPAEEGIRRIKAFLQTYPSFATAHNDLGVLYLRTGNSTLALAHYEKAARLQPDSILFKKNLADFYAVELGWYDDAVDMYLDILKRNPRDTEALIALGHLGNAMQSRNELPPTEEKPALEQASYHRQEPIQPQSQPALHPTTPTPLRSAEELHAEAVSHALAQRLQEAHSLLEELVHLYPDFAPGLNDLGVLRYQLGDINGSQYAYQQAVNIQPGNINFRKNLADLLYAALGKTDDAIGHYLELHKNFPKDVETLIALGHICAANNHPLEAKKFYTCAREIEPWNTDIQSALQNLHDKFSLQ